MLTTVAAGRVFNYSYCIGMYSMSGQGFWSPQDLAFGAGGVIYVVNRGAEELGQRISRCTLDHRFLGQFGAFGAGDGQFVWPRAIAIDRDENLYISDDSLNRIAILDRDGKFLDQWGTPGSRKGELSGPSGLALDADENLYVVDSLNNRVQVFTKDGIFLADWGRPGSGPGEFNLPWGICVDRQGDVYVADWKNSRVQKFAPDGEFRAEFRGNDAGVGALDRPAGVAVDQEGDVYVADWGSHRVLVYAPDGSFITALVGDAQQPSPWAQTYIDANPDIVKARRLVNLEQEWRFRRPTAVKVDDDNRIFVAEAARHRIQIYQKEAAFEEAPLNL